MAAAPRPLRADAERNRRRLLDSARTTFAEHGLGVGVDTIARAAGVGVGTLYRRFPTKEHLLRAIVRDQVEAFVAHLGSVDAVADPWEAFATAAEALARALADDRAFFQLLQQRREPLLDDDTRRRLYDALGRFLRRAQAAGVVRRDVVTEDLPALCAVAARLPAWRLAREPELWRRYLGVLLDGLRPEGAHALPHPPPAAVPRPAAGRDAARA